MARPRNPSIAAKLPLGVGALLFLVLGGMTAAAYVEVRRSSVAAAEERVGRLARQLATTFETAAKQHFERLHALTQNDEVARAASSAGDVEVAPLEQYVADNAQMIAIELWNASGTRVLARGAERAAMPAELARERIATLAPDALAVVGPFELVDDSLVYRIVAPIRRDDRVEGYVVELRRGVSTPQAVQALSELLGSDTRLLMGTIDGIWTDLTAPIEPPPRSVVASHAPSRYEDRGEPVLAQAMPIAGTPWRIAIATPLRRVFAAADQFLARAISLSLALAGIGAALGWVLSRQVTRPLQAVTAAAETIAAGRPAKRVATKRRDELGRLATSFNSMAEQVEQARARLERQAEHYRLLFDRNPLPMWVAHARSRALLDVNQAAVRHYGYSRERFLAMSVADLEVDAARRTETGGALSRHRRADGGVIDVEVTEHRFELDGDEVALTLAHDVTERLAAERALRASEEAQRELNAELERRVAERTEALEVANADLEAFSFSVSHDLRAPLRAIGGFSAAIEEDHGASLPAPAQRHLERVAGETKRMARMIDDLLAFSRLGRRAIERRPCSPRAIVEPIVESLRSSATDRRIEIAIADLPRCEADPRLLEHLFTNLLSNAFKFTRRRAIGQIEIGARVVDGEVRYFVRDNGAGFDAAHADRLFGVFQRYHRDDEFEGTGVGLALCQRIVHRHGGRIWAESAPDRGAAFYFTLGARPPSTRSSSSSSAT